MNSSNTGTNTSANSVTNISSFGFWLICNDKEYFVAFSDYPAFKKATVSAIFKVETLSPKQFYWPDLDIDIELDALDKPEQFPLAFK